MKINLLKKFLLLFFLFFTISIAAENFIQITPEEALEIGVKIWYNECSGTVSGLTTWNDGENFASLGIGHFIWYPYGKRKAYSDSFSQLIKFMEAHGVVVPNWLQGDWSPYCPWNNREQFLFAQNTSQMNELRQFLLDTIPYQVEFMIYRMEEALPKMLASVPLEERPYIQAQFYRIAQTPLGVYALVDYVNFKGIGVTPRGRMDLQGWGLLDVLENMKYAPGDMTAQQAFVWSANRVLTRRVLSESPYRHDWLWLNGWRNRLKTYLD